MSESVISLCSRGRFCFFKQKTAYEMRISDWSSDVCSSDLTPPPQRAIARAMLPHGKVGRGDGEFPSAVKAIGRSAGRSATAAAAYRAGVEITDERTGLVHDYTRKQGVEHSEQLGRTACRDRGCAYVYIPVGAVSLNK